MTQRSVTRVRTFLRATATHNYGNSTARCLVRDFSELGARLEIRDTVALPERFDLRVRDETYHARLVWRGADQVGVSFDKEGHDGLSPHADLARRVETLERRLERVELALADIQGRC